MAISQTSPRKRYDAECCSPWMKFVSLKSSQSSSEYPSISVSDAPQYHKSQFGESTRMMASESSVTSKSAYRLRLVWEEKV